MGEALGVCVTFGSEREKSRIDDESAPTERC